ncbi:MAG: VWA domain-containing protein [Verrucomicrobia bacterium]|nr:VWA domain-containing protein [Verrucomicrobiota bacterium]MBS0635973.1 VWA domain-containing protein [Verrucomicrobiota bacterium]
MRIDIATFIVLLMLLAIGFILHLVIHTRSPSLPITVLGPFLQKRNWKSLLSAVPGWLFWLSLIFLCIAMSHPRKVADIGPEYSVTKSEMPRSGVALYFLLDESGSMAEKVQGMPKIDRAKKAIGEFLARTGKKDDLIGLISFARVPEVLSPLTLNREEIAAKLQAVEPVQGDERNGTAIGYAIFKAVNIIVATKHFAERQQEAHKSVYSIKNQAIVIITDGLQSPNPADRDNPFRFMPPDEAINYAKDNGVRVFYIGIDPSLAKGDYKDDLQKMQKSMQGSGGELFLVSSSMPIDAILAQIDAMEKSELAPDLLLQQKPVHERSLVALFILLALASLGLAVVIETTVARSAP